MVGKAFQLHPSGRKRFNRRWNLADTIEVTGADFTNGLLTIHLKNIIPEEQKPRVISINTNAPTNQEFLAESK